MTKNPQKWLCSVIPPLSIVDCLLNPKCRFAHSQRNAPNKISFVASALDQAINVGSYLERRDHYEHALVYLPIFGISRFLDRALQLSQRTTVMSRWVVHSHILHSFELNQLLGTHRFSRHTRWAFKGQSSVHSVDETLRGAPALANANARLALGTLISTDKLKPLAPTLAPQFGLA
jgi:hypothetical protein